MKGTKMKTSEVEKMKKAICACITERGSGTSFVELGRYVPRFRYKKEGEGWILEFRKNLIIWAGMSKVAVEALIQLKQEKRITLKCTTSLIYLIDGMCLRFPIAKRDMDYKKPHWSPVALSLAK